MSVARRNYPRTSAVSRTLRTPAAGSVEAHEYLRAGTPDAEQRGVLPLREREFCAWVAKAGPGEIFEYYRGFLAIDRTRSGEPMSLEERRSLVRIGVRAMRLAEAGLVHLVQRRLGPDSFSYLAIVRPRPKKAPASLSVLLLEEAA